MKIVKVPILLFLLCLLVHKILLPFSLSLSFHQQQSLLVPNLTSLLKSYNKFVMFFTFNFILVTMLLGYSKPSNKDFDSEFVVSNVDDNEKLEDSGDGNSDFVPCLGYIELVDSLVEDKYFDGAISEVDGDDFHGYDGYDEDNDVDCGGIDDDYSEDENDDLQSRIEEFIARNNRKWKEEHLTEKFALVRRC